MAWATGTRSRRLAPAGRLAGQAWDWLRANALSRVARGIVLLNFIILLGMGFTLAVVSEMRQAYVDTKLAALEGQARMMANVLTETAVDGEPEPQMNADRARSVLLRVISGEDPRVIIFDKSGEMVADSDLANEAVRMYPLPPAGEPGFGEQVVAFGQELADSFRRALRGRATMEAQGRTILDEVEVALAGRTVGGERMTPEGVRTVRFVMPVREVAAVVGAVVYESSDLDALIARERAALIPTFLIAFIGLLLNAGALAAGVAAPVRRLADAAREVRTAGGRRVPLPDFSRRQDEIGELGRAFSSMTEALYDRLDAIESFAADVSHEIKNPLTSIRSAAEVLARADDPEKRAKLIGVIQSDVKRLDRLVTDISNASRLDAELARAEPAPVDIARLAADLAALHAESNDRGVSVRAPEARDVFVIGHEGPLSRVLSNLIDNAVTFSPEHGEVRLALKRGPGEGAMIALTVDDDGPGVPPENLESIFERFYTRRPEGAAFGTHSGLGLAIARQIVEAHGGALTASNRTDAEGRTAGARFTVRLPAAR